MCVKFILLDYVVDKIGEGSKLNPKKNALRDQVDLTEVGKLEEQSMKMGGSTEKALN
jgi:hypothetical protein